MKKIIVLAFMATVSSQGYAMKKNEKTSTTGATKKFSITSSAFTHYGAIPSSHTCDGDDSSPRLSWSNAPKETKSFALICDDPDAPMGTFVHWVVYNIPAKSTGMPGGVPADELLIDGSKQGMTSFKKIGFGGPCPPSGKHRYYFKLYALDTVLGLPARATKEQLLTAMKGHIKAQAELVGTYERKR